MPESYPRSGLQGDQIVFRSPRIFTVFLTVYLLFLPALGLLAVPGQIADVLQEHDSLSVTLGWSAAFVAFFVGFPLAFSLPLFAMLAGPSELCLDKKQRTYRLRFGTFLKRRVRSGSWEDIEGIRVERKSAKGSVFYGVYIAWRSGLSGGPPLGFAGELDQAQRLAERLARELGLQFVGTS